MAVIEFGVMMDGLPVFTKDWRKYAESSDSNEKLLRTGLMSAIQSFASDAFGDVMDSMTLKNFKIYFHLIVKLQKNKTCELILYAIADEKTKSSKKIKKSLIKSGQAISDAPENIFTLTPEKNAFINKIVEKEFKKLKS